MVQVRRLIASPSLVGAVLVAVSLLYVFTSATPARADGGPQGGYHEVGLCTSRVVTVELEPDEEVVGTGVCPGPSGATAKSSPLEAVEAGYAALSRTAIPKPPPQPIRVQLFGPPKFGVYSSPPGGFADTIDIAGVIPISSADDIAGFTPVSEPVPFVTDDGGAKHWLPTTIWAEFTADVRYVFITSDNVKTFWFRERFEITLTFDPANGFQAPTIERVDEPPSGGGPPYPIG